ncbi:MAG: esterase-like activity of phytase family protein [Caulobacterales bacterium]
MKRFAALAAALLFLAAPGPIDPRSPTLPEDEPVAISAQALSVPASYSLGSLRLLSALRLTSKDMRFGGWSGLHVEPNGDVLMLSDRALLLRGRLTTDKNGATTGIAGAEIGLLRDKNGAPLPRDDADSEGVTRLRDGRYALSFETNSRIAFYDFAGKSAGAPPQQTLFFQGANKLSRNQQLEALTTLADGALLVGSERGEGGNDQSILWRVPVAAQTGSANEIPKLATYKLPDGYSLTELAGAPDGSVYALLRFYLPFIGAKAQIRRFQFVEENGKTTLTSELLAQLEPPFPTDNYEGLALGAGPGGTQLLYVLSDDNYRPEQKSILLTFELMEKPASKIADTKTKKTP